MRRYSPLMGKSVIAEEGEHGLKKLVDLLLVLDQRMGACSSSGDSDCKRAISPDELLLSNKLAALCTLASHPSLVSADWARRMDISMRNCHTIFHFSLRPCAMVGLVEKISANDMGNFAFIAFGGTSRTTMLLSDMNDDNFDDFVTRSKSKVGMSRYLAAYVAVRDQLLEQCLAMTSSSHRLLITGHGMGSALAVLLASELAIDHGISLQIKLVTFGCPKVFDAATAKRMENFSEDKFIHFRFTNDGDLVPDWTTAVQKESRYVPLHHFGISVHLKGEPNGVVDPPDGGEASKPLAQAKFLAAGASQNSMTSDNGYNAHLARLPVLVQAQQASDAALGKTFPRLLPVLDIHFVDLEPNNLLLATKMAALCTFAQFWSADPSFTIKQSAWVAKLGLFEGQIWFPKSKIKKAGDNNGPVASSSPSPHSTRLIAVTGKMVNLTSEPRAPTAVVVMRGNVNASELLQDLSRATLVDFRTQKGTLVGRVCEGLLANYLDLRDSEQSLVQCCVQLASACPGGLVLTGHGGGGALALLLAAELGADYFPSEDVNATITDAQQQHQQKQQQPSMVTMTFGCPRVFDRASAGRLGTLPHLQRHTRFVCNGDYIPALDPGHPTAPNVPTTAPPTPPSAPTTAPSLTSCGTDGFDEEGGLCHVGVPCYRKDKGSDWTLVWGPRAQDWGAPIPPSPVQLAAFVSGGCEEHRLEGDRGYGASLTGAPMFAGALWLTEAPVQATFRSLPMSPDHVGEEKKTLGALFSNILT